MNNIAKIEAQEETLIRIVEGSVIIEQEDSIVCISLANIEAFILMLRKAKISIKESSKQ